uniref:Uncharacterized protein n=1 Tax=Amphimedon queenslandica TaxID=400682 RepID=A0A1X7VVR6_AMPQE
MLIVILQAAWVLVSQNQVQLSQFYIRTMKSISQKLVIKLDPTIKRTICKSCDALQVPGITCTHRIRVRPQRHVVIKCLMCKTYKKFFTKDYDGSSTIANS